MLPAYARLMRNENDEQPEQSCAYSYTYYIQSEWLYQSWGNGLYRAEISAKQKIGQQQSGMCPPLIFQEANIEEDWLMTVLYCSISNKLMSAYSNAAACCNAGSNENLC